MPQQIQCPHCGQAYELSDEQAPQYAGRTITCTRCSTPFTVPGHVGGSAPTTTPPSPPPAAPQYQPAAGIPSHLGQGQHPYGYGETYPYSNQPAPQTSALAIAALVIGIIGLIIPLLGLVALVLGIMALSKMRDRQVGGKGLAIAGICVGAAGLAMNICALSILIPAIRTARDAANRVHCGANMRQIGQAIAMYANENNGAYPDKIEKVLVSQDITSEVFVCPSTNDTPAPGPAGQPQSSALNAGGHFSYVYVGSGLTNSASANTIVMYEPLGNHGEGANFLYGDGHVDWQEKALAGKLIGELKAGLNRPKAVPATRP